MTVVEQVPWYLWAALSVAYSIALHSVVTKAIRYLTGKG